MEALRNFSSIIHSHPFTFLVGPNHTKLTIQSGLANHVSRPLDHLMNSGETRESKHHIAVLEEEDVETFVAFCEYAYTGDYAVPPPGSREDEKERVVNNPFKGFLRGETAATDAARGATESVGSPSVAASVNGVNGFGGFHGHGFLPPPAPSPPPRSVVNGYGPPGYHPGYGVNGFEGLNGKSWEEMRMSEVKVPEQAIDDDDDDDDDVPLPPLPAQEQDQDAKPVEQPEQQSTEKPAEPKESQQPPEPTEDVPEGKGKKGKKSKKDKKKKGNTEEAPNLTPPTTPPAKHPENPGEAVGEPGLDVAGDGGHGEPAAESAQTLSVETAVDTTADKTEPKPELKPEPNPEGGRREEKEEMANDEPELHQQQQETFPLFTLRNQGINMWDEFKTLDYVDQRPTYPTPRSMVAKACTVDDLPYLTFHAKVYVFATRYLIPALAQLCLHKLHRDLLYLAFPVDPEFSSAAAAASASAIANANEEEEHEELQKIKARMVLDLLHYTYSKTTRLEPAIIFSGSGLEREEKHHQRPSELRKLVVHYAACKVRDLAAYRPVMANDRKPASGGLGLRGLLDTMTELASDLVFRMM